MQDPRIRDHPGFSQSQSTLTGTKSPKMKNKASVYTVGTPRKSIRSSFTFTENSVLSHRKCPKGPDNNFCDYVRNSANLLPVTGKAQSFRTDVRNLLAPRQDFSHPFEMTEARQISMLQTMEILKMRIVGNQDNFYISVGQAESIYRLSLEEQSPGRSYAGKNC